MPKRLRFREVVVRRDPATGHFARKGVKGAKIERFTFQVSREGKFVRAISIEAGKTILKHATVADTGENQGMIFDALAKTNVLSARTVRGAKRVEVEYRGTHQGKPRMFRFSFDVIGQKKVDEIIIGRIVRDMHQRGYRTNYPVRVIPYGKREKKHGLTATDIGRFKRLEGVKITVRVRR